MTTMHPFRKSSILALTLLAGVVGALFAQNAGRLYLVTGLDSIDAYNSKSEILIPSEVYGVDESGHTLVKLATLADADKGADFIVADHERRVLAVGSPKGRPTTLTILNMDSPASPHSLEIGLSEFRFRPQDVHFVDRLGSSTILALRESDQPKTYLRGIDLVSQDSLLARVDLAWDAIKFTRTEGSWGPGDYQRGLLELRYQDGKVVTNRGGVVVEMGYPFPRSFEAEAKQTFLLDVSNDEILVIDRRNERGLGLSGPLGVTRLSIYDKAAKTWNTETFEGGGSSVRGFGTWIGVNVADAKVDYSKPTVAREAGEKQSPGRQLRQHVINPQDKVSDQLTIDGLFNSADEYFPGTIDLFETRSKKKYRINTGQGDSEVLLISGTTIYYRVNDSLYRAQIGKNEIENTVEVVKDSNLQMAHWAFLGP